MQKIKYCLISLTISSIFLSTLVSAQEINDGNVLQRMDDLNVEIVLLEKQLEIEELKKEIKEAKQGKGSDETEADVAPFFQQNEGAKSRRVPDENKDIDIESLKTEIRAEVEESLDGAYQKLSMYAESSKSWPHVVKITGTDEENEAVLSYNDGSIIKVVVGDEVNGYEVSEISGKGVVVQKGEKRKQLRMKIGHSNQDDSNFSGPDGFGSGESDNEVIEEPVEEDIHDSSEGEEDIHDSSDGPLF